MSLDLGTYHLRVEFTDGTGYLAKYTTGRRYTGGNTQYQPLDASVILPPFSDEEDLKRAILYQYTDGNFSCDCNRRLALDYAYQQDLKEEYDCGYTLTLYRLTLVCPDSTEKLLYEVSNES